MGSDASLGEMEQMSQSCWESTGRDRHMNSELTKVQTKCCRSPKKGMINFDWEEREIHVDLKGKESAK